MPYNEYTTYQEVPAKLLGNIQIKVNVHSQTTLRTHRISWTHLQAEKKYKFLEGKNWAVPLLLKDAYDNKKTYRKKKARKAKPSGTNSDEDEIEVVEPAQQHGSAVGPGTNQPDAGSDHPTGQPEPEREATRPVAGKGKGKGRAQRTPSISDLTDNLTEVDEEDEVDDIVEAEEQEITSSNRGKKRSGPGK
jgi:hypothetical protein